MAFLICVGFSDYVVFGSFRSACLTT
ncbi:DUF3265 domain-containing protein [Vibrio vulnificus]|nr:DUF3265 domain-containing protein [Vibrio vulnificus]